MLSLPHSRASSRPTISTGKPWFVRYGIAVVAVAVALGLSWLLPAIRIAAPFTFFFLAVIFTALWGGFRAGILSIVLAFFAVDGWIMPPLGLFLRSTNVQFFQLFTFLIVSTTILWLVRTLDNARRTIYEQSESLRITLASIGDGVIASDARGSVVLMNAVAATLTGWQIDEATGKPLPQIFNVIDEQTRLPIENPVARVMHGRTAGLSNNTILIAKDGTEWPIDESAAPIQDAQGNVSGVVLIFHDVTERRQREQALQLIGERLRMALHAGRVVAWEWDTHTKEVWTNESFAHIYGTNIQKTVEGMQLVHPEDFAHYDATIQDTVSHSGSYHTEYRIIRPDDNRTIWIEEWGSAIRDPIGKVQKLIGVSADITERKATEVALMHLNETLEQRVAKRTAELELINHELVQFTYVVSHDLKSPLRSIATLSNWISEEAAHVLPAHSKNNLIKIRQRIQRMETMLNDLVTYTRAGRVRYKVEQVNLAFLTKDIISLLDAHPDFTATVVEPMPIFVAERVPLETVLLNLIGNAFKHHHQPDAGHVTISARDLGQSVEVTVADDGPGIASDYHGRIFGVLQTLRPRDEVEGSGMGLAIAKRLVEGRGGFIDIQSEPNKGSTFTFTWPKQNPESGSDATRLA